MTRIDLTRPSLGSKSWVLVLLSATTSGGVLLQVLPVVIAATLIVCVTALTVLAAWDTRTHRLPNIATLALSVAGLAAAGALLAVGQTASMWPALSGFAGFAVLGFVEALPRDSLGGGDAKLLAAVGAWTGLLGWSALLPTLLCTHLVMLTALTVGRARGRGRVVMGPAIAAGTVVSWMLVGLAA